MRSVRPLSVMLGMAACVATAAGVCAAPIEVPILYNDHHVNAAPDTLRRDRVLAAIFNHGVVLVPLRAMFESMGATVRFDASTKTFVATRGTTTISVRVGIASAQINGETRALDAPPIVYRGAVVVPIRVISEALGAYVEWEPARHVVVVRYLPPTPPPTPSPPPAPSPIPVPTALPSAPAPVREYAGFFAGALTIEGKDYNEFHTGPYCRNGSYVASGVYRPLTDLAIKINVRQDRYVTTTGFTDANGNQFTVFRTIDGGVARVPVFMAQQDLWDARLEYRVASPKVYVGVGYARATTDYGYPRLSGAGIGVEKLPDFIKPISLYASAFYYPRAQGDYTVSDRASSNAGVTYTQRYSILTYDVGAAWQFSPGAPLFAYGGFAGDRYSVKQNAPIGQTHSGFYAGLGMKI